MKFVTEENFVQVDFFSQEKTFSTGEISILQEYCNDMGYALDPSTSKHCIVVENTFINVNGVKVFRFGHFIKVKKYINDDYIGNNPLPYHYEIIYKHGNKSYNMTNTLVFYKLLKNSLQNMKMNNFVKLLYKAFCILDLEPWKKEYVFTSQ